MTENQPYPSTAACAAARSILNINLLSRFGMLSVDKIAEIDE
jgi:hypothetical protein